MLLLAAAALTAAPPSTIAGALPKLVVSSVKVKTPNPSAVCRESRAKVVEADGRNTGTLMPQALTELPPGKMYVAVVRQDENGCLSPIIVKDDIGR